MEVDSLPTVPTRVQIKEIVSSRYPDGVRPSGWDDRVPGIDVVRTCENQTLRLKSDGQQSPPQPTWVVLITGGDSHEGYTWTLYGLPGVH